jgi:hypothetical protein
VFAVLLLGVLYGVERTESAYCIMVVW